jgi:ubiquinone/menaquinone biosynthesis C-methylase UbiE
MVDAVARFSGFSEAYDRARPRPPAVLAEVICQWADIAAPEVVDLGSGSGLSLLPWAGRARRVTAVEPSAGMREVAAGRIAALGAGAEAFTLVDATAEDTGLPAESADIVTASQAMHWFDPDRALPEIARILRPGGVVAAYDCDWPPSVDWETDAAYETFHAKTRALEDARGLRPPYADKRDHAGRMRRSGLFRFVTEMAVHSREEGDAGRLIDIALSQGGAVALRDGGVSENELGLTGLRGVAARRLGSPKPWWWTYRVRMAVR